MLLSIPLEGLKSYGDYWNYYYLASLGTPFIDYWVEFPPVFPIFFRSVYLAVVGREHAFIYSLIILFSIIQAANLYLFQTIAIFILGENEAAQRSIIYGLVLVNLFYGWAYFDCLAVFFILLGLLGMLKNRNVTVGIAAGIGGLTKWFPILLLPSAWKWNKPRNAFWIILISLIIIGFTWGILWTFSPDLTFASLASQFNKGSWETIWAVIDGNLRTGNFSPLVDRKVPETAFYRSGSPAVISPWITLIVFGCIGFLVFLRAELNDNGKLISFVTFTLILFYLWSPGYSPQWVLTLIPLVLLSFERLRSLLICLLFTVVNLLEWPVILSRGWFHLLDEVVILRTIIYSLVAVLLVQNIYSSKELNGEDIIEGN